MELVLPNNYVEIEEEEMMYLDGGGSFSIFKRNIQGAWKRFSNFSHALRAWGWSWGYLGNMLSHAARYGMSWLYLNFSAPTIQLGFTVGGIIGLIVTSVGAVAAITYLCNYRVFY